MRRSPIRRTTRPLPLALLSLTLAGCTNMGTLADILASGAGVYGNETSGEIRGIDTRRREIQLQSGWGGGERIRYDGRTQVLYGQRRYDVRDLQRGDYVRIWFDGNSRQNARYARRIEVQESGRGGRTGRTGNSVQRFDGRIIEIDRRGGWFEMEEGRRATILVMLPYDANRQLVDRFQRLRRGDRVRVEGRMLGGNRMELLRFR